MAGSIFGNDDEQDDDILSRLTEQDDQQLASLKRELDQLRRLNETLQEDLKRLEETNTGHLRDLAVYLKDMKGDFERSMQELLSRDGDRKEMQDKIVAKQESLTTALNEALAMVSNARAKMEMIWDTQKAHLGRSETNMSVHTDGGAVENVGNTINQEKSE